MGMEQYFPIWDQLTRSEQQVLTNAAKRTKAAKGTVLHSDSADCLGLLLICSGQLRASILSEEGKEITIYRLLEHDICLFSASCMMQSIQFDVFIEVEKDAEFWIIPPYVYKKLMEQSAAVANYTNQIMASRFSDVVWLVEQVMWKSFDKRLAAFLLEEHVLDGTDELKITHDKIAQHMGTAREVVTRMLRYFQAEDMVALTRGSVKLTDIRRLRELAENRS